MKKKIGAKQGPQQAPIYTTQAKTRLAQIIQAVDAVISKKTKKKSSKR